MRTATSEASWHPKGLYLGDLTCSQKTGKAAPRKWWSSWGLKAEQALPSWQVEEHSVECNPDGQKGDTLEGLMWASVAGAWIARGSGLRWARRGSQGWDPAGPCWLWGFGFSSHTDIIGVFKQMSSMIRFVFERVPLTTMRRADQREWTETIRRLLEQSRQEMIRGLDGRSLKGAQEQWTHSRDVQASEGEGDKIPRFLLVHLEG